MPVKLYALPLNKFGAPPLVIISEQKEHLQPYTIDAYIVWPELKQESESINRILHISMYAAGDAEIAQVMRLAAVEGVKHYSAVWANESPAPVEAINLEDVDLERLHALRSLGLYPGLNVARVLDGPALQFVGQLKEPFVFSR